eukprot:4963-Heterococcus_DN1.PRE.2
MQLVHRVVFLINLPVLAASVHLLRVYVCSRFYQCKTCRAVVHSACRSFYQSAACTAATTAAGATSSSSSEPPLLVNCAGVVRASILQAYKLPLAPGDTVYAVMQARARHRCYRVRFQVCVHRGAVSIPHSSCLLLCTHSSYTARALPIIGAILYLLQLLPWKERARTPTSAWGDMGALWTSSNTNSNSTNNTSAAANNSFATASSSTDTASATPAAVAAAAPAAAAVPLTEATRKTSSSSSSSSGAASDSKTSGMHGSSCLELLHLHNSESPPVPVLLVEVWRRALKIMDELLGSAVYTRHGVLAARCRSVMLVLEYPHVQHVSAAPLMRRPGAVCERWHLLTHPAQGMVLLSLSFHPKATLAQSMVLPPSPRRLQAAAASHQQQQQQQQQQSRHQRSLSYGSNTADAALADDSTAAATTVKIDSLKRESDSPTVATSDAILTAAEQQAAAAAVVDSSSSGAAAATSTAEAAAHMFRLRTYRKPAWCAVCSGALLGLYGQGFCCEVCSVDVHKRCQLRANFSILFASPHRIAVAVTLVKSELHLKSCTTAALTRRFTMLREQAADGDYYMRARVVGGSSDRTTTSGSSNASSAVDASQLEKRTRTVFQTANPLFDVHWSLPALSYDALLELELRDASNDRLLGVFDTTAFELLQREADAVAAHYTPLPSQESSWRELRDARGRVIGTVKLLLSFEEDRDALLWSSKPRAAPGRTVEDLNVDTIKRYVERAQALLQWVSAWTRAYKRIMSWESPLLTAAALAGFLYITLIASAEYVLASLPCGVLAYIAHSGLARRDGRYVQHCTAFCPQRQWSTLHRQLHDYACTTNVSTKRSKFMSMSQVHESTAYAL